MMDGAFQSFWHSRTLYTATHANPAIPARRIPTVAVIPSIHSISLSPFVFSIVLLHPALCQDGCLLFRCKVFVRRLPAHGQDLPCLFFSPLDRCQELVDLPAQSLIRAVVQHPLSTVCHQAVQNIDHGDLMGISALSANEIGKVLCGQRNQVFFSFTAAAVVHTGVAHGIGVPDPLDHLFIF